MEELCNLPTTVLWERVYELSDEDFYEELQSAVGKMGDESLLKSAVELVNVLKRNGEKIVKLQSTIEIQGKKLHELKSKESVRADSSMPSPQESTRKRMRISEFIYFPRSTASLSKLSCCFRHGRKAKVGISPGAEVRWIDQLSNEEFYCELQSAVQETGDESLMKSVVEFVDILKHHNEKIAKFQSTVEIREKKIQELKSKGSVTDGLENLEVVSAGSSVPLPKDLESEELESAGFDIFSEMKRKICSIMPLEARTREGVQLWDEEFFRKLLSCVEQDECRLKSIVEFRNIVKNNARRTRESIRRELELKSKEIPGASLQNPELALVGTSMPFNG